MTPIDELTSSQEDYLLESELEKWRERKEKRKEKKISVTLQEKNQLKILNNNQNEKISEGKINNLKSYSPKIKRRTW